MNIRKNFLWFLCGILMLLCAFISVSADETGTDLVILSTTDMHGKCWEKNLLTGADEQHNMLRVSSAVQEIRNAYGKENVILIDNGDLFQGTPVSEVHLFDDSHAENESEAMSLCLKEIGYDALVLGNHEFNYSWEKICSITDDLRKGNVAVLAANAYWDGSDRIHTAGENAFGTRIIREISVNGHLHKVGVLGLENTEITRWDSPEKYPGIIFTSPDNPAYDMAREVNRYLSQMQDEGCEMIVLSFHAGLGTGDSVPVFGISTENQGLWVLRNTDCLDLLILGHDHSNTFFVDKAERQVPVVNGGSQDMTMSVFRLTEDEDGKLICELKSTENLNLPDFEPDRKLEEKIRPYAEQADARMDEPIGRLTGEWDGSLDFYNRQTDTLDLVLAAMIDTGTRRMTAKYAGTGLETLKAKGLDHTDADAAIMTAVNGGYIAHSGAVSTRDTYGMFFYNNTLLVIPMTGKDLRNVMEENAAQRLTARILNDRAYFFTKNDLNTHLIFGGINFRYDMSRPEGEQVLIDGFANGRPFDPDRTYLVTVISYILGNADCGLRKWSINDALWSQQSDDGGFIQDCIQEYIAGQTERYGSITPDMMNWKWSVTWSENPAALPPYDGPAAASLAEAPRDGHRYVLYHEAQQSTVTDQTDSSSSLITAEIPAHGNDLTGSLPDNALVFTAHLTGEDTLMLTDQYGRYLTCIEKGGLSLTDEAAEGNLSDWQLIPAEPGYYVKSVGAENEQALEYYNQRIMTYTLGSGEWYLFNFYEVNGR